MHLSRELYNTVHKLVKVEARVSEGTLEPEEPLFALGHGESYRLLGVWGSGPMASFGQGD